MEFYEYFNTTNQTRPIASKHLSMIYDGPELTPVCPLVQSIPYDLRCRFINTFKNCTDTDFIINYLDILYCQIQINTDFGMKLGILFILFVFLYIFEILAEVTHKYLCPSLKVLSRKLRLSETMAGVTLLAYCNGAPDVAMNLVYLKYQGNSIYSDIYGSTILIVTMIAGIVMVLRPFKGVNLIMLRDILFFVLHILSVDVLLISKGHTVTMRDAILTLGLYFAYIVVITIDTVLVKLESMKLKRKGQLEGLNLSEISRSTALHNDDDFDIKSTQSAFSFGSDHMLVDIEANRWIYYNPENAKNQYLLGQMFDTLTPISIEEFLNASFCRKLLFIVQMPTIFVCSIWIPIVDFEKPLHGWSKLLNCLQIVLSPYLMIVIALDKEISFYKFTYANSACFLLIPVSLVMLHNTRTDLPPPFHGSYSIFGVLCSIFIMFCCATEAKANMAAIAVAMYRSASFLGCTFMAWDMCIGDLVANTVMALHGYNKMAFAACLGGALFNSAISIGFIFYENAVNTGESKIHEGTLTENCRFTIVLAMFGLILSLCATDFVARRSIGIFLIVMYAIFFGFIVLGEFEIIHTFGYDHSTDWKTEPDFDF